MATEVVGTDEFREWYDSLPEAAQHRVEFVVDQLAEAGMDLGHPYSTAIVGSSIAMRELRVKHKGEPIRVLYVFDPFRQAVLLLGGNKVGKGNRWYTAAIRDAERIYAMYLKEISGG